MEGKTITSAALRRRVEDGIVRVTEWVSCKGKLRVNLVILRAAPDGSTRVGQPRTLEVVNDA